MRGFEVELNHVYFSLQFLPHISSPHHHFLLLQHQKTGEGGTAGTTTNTSMATGSAHYSQADNPTVIRDAKAAARVDLSSVRRKYKSECVCPHFCSGLSIFYGDVNSVQAYKSSL